jgi:hypothetical protein
MTARGWLAPFVSFSCVLCVISTPSGAQDSQTSQFETYRDLRSALLAEGWKPDTRYGLRDNSQRPLYRFPEVLCGPKLCNAKWTDAKGKETTITLLRGEGKEDYRVAPR